MENKSILACETPTDIDHLNDEILMLDERTEFERNRASIYDEIDFDVPMAARV